MHLPKFDRKMKQIRKIIPLLFLISGYGFSQNLNSNTGHGGDYLVFDASKSFQGNELIDHLQFLISNSESTALPANVESMLDAVQEDPQIHPKLTTMRASVLKVLYNERISPEDKKFICNHYLNQSNNDKYGPILSILQNYVTNGTL